MANSTFSGPVRSQNGFQEWNGTAWVPVAGGGGGGTTFIELVSQYGGSVYGATDNRYSSDFNQDPPTGPTAGTIIQLPDMAVGDTCVVYGNGGNQYDAWALQLPTIAGVDLAYFKDSRIPISVQSGDFPSYTLITYYLYSGVSGPPDTFFVYGVLSDSIASLKITRMPNFDYPGFGTIAPFGISGIPITSTFPLGDPYVYPFSQVIPAP